VWGDTLLLEKSSHHYHNHEPETGSQQVER
jgi:hypothetical protein